MKPLTLDALETCAAALRIARIDCANRADNGPTELYRRGWRDEVARIDDAMHEIDAHRRAAYEAASDEIEGNR